MSQSLLTMGVVQLLVLLLLQQHHSWLAESAGLSERQLTRPPDDDRQRSRALSGNLNAAATPVPAKPIKTIVRQANLMPDAVTEAVTRLPMELFQATLAKQLPLSTLPATVGSPPLQQKFRGSFAAPAMTTRAPAVLDPLAATLDAETSAPTAAGVPEARAASAKATATTASQEQHMRAKPARPAQMAEINTPETGEKQQIGAAVISTHPATKTSKIDIPTTVGTATAAAPAPAPAPAPATASAIMPAKTKRTQTDGANKVVDGAGMKFNMNTTLDAAQSYANSSEGWPTMATNDIAASPISPAIMGTPTTMAKNPRPGTGKSIPTPRLLWAGDASQILAKALGNPIHPPSPSAAPSASGWPVKHAAVLEGDVILGGLMMVHSREDSITCGPIMPQGGIQALEAMLYTLDQVNKQQLLPNVTLGAHLLDDCDKDTYGLEMAVDFIKGKGAYITT